jgi:hypothetical protein
MNEYCDFNRFLRQNGIYIWQLNKDKSLYLSDRHNSVKFDLNSGMIEISNLKNVAKSIVSCKSGVVYSRFGSKYGSFIRKSPSQYVTDMGIEEKRRLLDSKIISYRRIGSSTKYETFAKPRFALEYASYVCLDLAKMMADEICRFMLADNDKESVLFSALWGDKDDASVIFDYSSCSNPRNALVSCNSQMADAQEIQSQEKVNDMQEQAAFTTEANGSDIESLLLGLDNIESNLGEPSDAYKMLYESSTDLDAFMRHEVDALIGLVDNAQDNTKEVDVFVGDRLDPTQLKHVENADESAYEITKDFSDGTGSWFRFNDCWISELAVNHIKVSGDHLAVIQSHPAAKRSSFLCYFTKNGLVFLSSFPNDCRPLPKLTKSGVYGGRYPSEFFSREKYVNGKSYNQLKKQGDVVTKIRCFNKGGTFAKVWVAMKYIHFLSPAIAQNVAEYILDKLDVENKPIYDKIMSDRRNEDALAEYFGGKKIVDGAEGAEIVETQSESESSLESIIRRWQHEAVASEEKHSEESSVEYRKEFCKVLSAHGVTDDGYGTATNAMYQGLFGRTAREIRDGMGLGDRESVRTHIKRAGDIYSTALDFAELLSMSRIKTEKAHGDEACAKVCYEVGRKICAAMIA